MSNTQSTIETNLNPEGRELLVATRRYRTAMIRGCCVLTAADGRSVTYESCGGYIHAVHLPDRPGALGSQVCDRLQGSGSTLSASTDAAMLRVIRREARKAFKAGGEPAYLREVRQ